MANRDWRESLRGAEEEFCDLLSEVLPSKQWVKLMRAPLGRAAAKGNRGLVQKLVGAGGEIKNALPEAVRGGHEVIVNDLLEGGASVTAKEADGGTLLHLAAREGKSGMVQFLMDKGADRDALDRSKCTPLYLAVCHGHVAAALTLLAAGADISLRCSSNKESVVHAATGRGCVEMFLAVIEHGANVDAADKDQYTALHVASVRNQADMIDALVKAGANIEARTGSNDTPLHLAVSHLRLEALLALVKHGADVNSLNRHRRMPLHTAARKAGIEGAAEAVDALLRAGADEAILDNQGKAAADVINTSSPHDLLVEDVEPVRRLLANAPADRAWRRRGFLVLCRAYPDRVQLTQESNSAPAGAGRRTRRGTKPERTEASGCTGTAGYSTSDERASSDWAGLIAMVLRAPEDGIFRAIVGYL